MTKVRRHKNRVAAMGCLLCAELDMPGTPAELHHVREGQGMSQRASDYMVIGLCPEHHRGKSGWHGDRAAFRQAKVDELDLLARVIERLAQ